MVWNWAQIQQEKSYTQSETTKIIVGDQRGRQSYM